MCSGSVSGLAEIKYTVVAHADVTDGDLLPGAAPGSRLRDFSQRGFSIDDEGNVVFQGTLTAEGEGIWAGKPGDLRLVAKENSDAPGGEKKALGFGNFGPALPGIHGGRVSFTAQFDLPSLDLDKAFWQEREEGLVLGAREGDPAPGGGEFDDFQPGPTILSNGKTVFPDGFLTRTCGVYWGEPGDWRSVAVNGGSARGIPGTTIFGFDTFVAQHDGGFAYEVTVVPGFDTGIYYGSGATALETLVIATDMTAPGTGGKEFSNQFSYPSVGADGSMAITGIIFGSGLNTDSASGIWTKRHGESLTKVVQGDTTAPGTGARFKRLLTNTELHAPVCDGHGRMAFIAKTSDSSRDGIWFGNEDGLDLVAFEGHPAVGTDSTWQTLEKPFVSQAGHVAYRGHLEGGGLGPDGLWMTDVDGQLHKIIAEGDQVEVRGQLVTATEVRFVLMGNSVGRLSSINSLGQAVFLLGSEIGQTMMIAEIPVPENLSETELLPDGDGFNLRIASRRAFRYQLQSSDSLDEWADVGDPVSGNGGFLTFDLPNDGPRKFYRLAISLVR